MIDFKIPGTKLPKITATNIKYRINGAWSDSKEDEFGCPIDELVSFGTKLFKGEMYILAEQYYYSQDWYYMFKLKDLNKLANINQKEFILPEKWCIKDCKEVTEWAQNNIDKDIYSNICITTPYLNINQKYYPEIRCYSFEKKLDNYTEITLEEFKKHILKENMNTLQVGQIVPELKNITKITTYDDQGNYISMARYSDIKDRKIKTINNDLFQLVNDTITWFKISDFIDKEIIGYKLTKPEYAKAAANIEGYHACGEGNIIGKIFTIADNSLSIERWKNTEVLDLWFEPVYKEEFTYKVGDYLYCIKDFVMDLGDTAFKQGKVYKSERNGCITNEKNNQEHFMEYDLGKNHGHISNYFRHATQEEIAKSKEEVIKMEDGFELIIRDNKVYHKNEEITDYVKQIELLWKVTLNNGKMKFGNYDLHIEPYNLVFDKTGCQSKRTMLSQWLNVANKIK